MISLLRVLFRKFGGVFVEVRETISGGMWEVFGGKIKKISRTNKNTLINPLRYYNILSKIA